MSQETKPRLEVQLASEIQMKAAKWLWHQRIPLGSLSLLAGAEGIGKSSLTYNFIAQVTNGTLDGYYKGTPKSVFIIATEDSWEHTIVPRLNAAGADLNRVAMVEVEVNEERTEPLTFPDDVEELGKEARANDVALIVLDPLMSRIGGVLDTHKDSEVRQALEPLVKMAGESGAAVVGIIHINKKNSSDMLNNIMASRAFTAVSRAVLYVQEDQEDRDTKYVNQAKSNLGPSIGMTDLSFQIRGKKVGEYESEEFGKEDITASYLVWTGERFGAARDNLNYKPKREKVGDGRPARIVEFIKDNPGLSKSKIYENIGGSRNEFFDDMKALQEQGHVVVIGFKVLTPADEDTEDSFDPQES